ncbi:MAG: DNA replication terminus site-binding protein [Pontibacterium sp.]
MPSKPPSSPSPADEQAIIHDVRLLAALVNEFAERFAHGVEQHRLFTADEQQLHTKQPADAALAFQSIWHTQSGDGRQTQNLYGAIACQASVLDLATAINQQKLTLKETITQCYSAHPSLSHYRRQKHLNDLLSREGLARLHLQQAYRQIPILPSAPKRISFSWYKQGKSIKRISIEQAQQQLLQLATESPHIQAQLKQLESLRPNTKLAQVQTQAPLLRANITWELSGEPLRKAQNSPLPLLFLANGSFPNIQLPKSAKAQAARPRRNDTQLADSPLLPSIRVYTYLS